MVLIPTSGQAQNVDSGLVRIRIDRDSVSITVDSGEPLAVDSYGNPLTRESWFILFVTAGIHVFTFTSDAYGTIERRVTVLRDEVTTLEIAGDDPAAPGTSSFIGPPTEAQDLIRLVATSDPPGATIRIENWDERPVTPAEINLPAGEYKLTATLERHEPLTHLEEVLPGRKVVVHFILKEERPARFSAVALQQDYRMEVPLTDEAHADNVKKRFTSLAETFAIIPLAQGATARLFMGEESRRAANALIIAGIGLTVGSYLTGRILSATRRSRIRSRNQLLTEQNARAVEHNKRVDEMIREKNAEAIALWRARSSNRGRVEVTVE